MKIYLFDWGDTLMVDFPESKGKMCYWESVAEVDGAGKALSRLSIKHKIYIATGAADSSENDIKRALSRVNLSQYISGYFCQSNLGAGKDNPNFFGLILDKLKCPASSVVMVGDSYTRDIKPAQNIGINAIWYNPFNKPVPTNVKSIASLVELCK